MSVTWSGLTEFKNALKKLPAELTEEAAAIVVSHAYEAERLVEGAYPEGPTGNLRRGVTTKAENSSRFGASATVKSGARHAHLFEGGYRGKAPRRQVPDNQKMIPIVIRVRRRMVQQLIHMVQKAGLVVTES